MNDVEIKSDGGHWVTIEHTHVLIKNGKIDNPTIAAALEKHGVSEAGKKVIQKAHEEGKVTTDAHLYRAIAHAKNSIIDKNAITKAAREGARSTTSNLEKIKAEQPEYHQAHLLGNPAYSGGIAHPLSEVEKAADLRYRGSIDKYTGQHQHVAVNTLEASAHAHAVGEQLAHSSHINAGVGKPRDVANVDDAANVIHAAAQRAYNNLPEHMKNDAAHYEAGVAKYGKDSAADNELYGQGRLDLGRRIPEVSNTITEHQGVADIRANNPAQSVEVPAAPKVEPASYTGAGKVLRHAKEYYDPTQGFTYDDIFRDVNNKAKRDRSSIPSMTHDVHMPIQSLLQSGHIERSDNPMRAPQAGEIDPGSVSGSHSGRKRPDDPSLYRYYLAGHKPAGKSWNPLEDIDLMNETLIYEGCAVKSLGGRKIGGYLCIFSTANDPDLVQDFFDTKSTDFDFEDGDKRSIYFNHGVDPEIGTRKLGTATLKKTDVGVWMEGVLKESDEYADAILKMVEAGKMGFSSGAVAHLVRRTPVTKKVNRVDAWPIGECSITHTPAEPRTFAMPLKSWIDWKQAENPPLPDEEEETNTLENEAAPTEQVKAAFSITTLRQYEDFLRDAGWSRKQATGLALHGYNSLRDAGEPEPITPAAETPPLIDEATRQAREMKFRRLSHKLEGLLLASQ